MNRLPGLVQGLLLLLASPACQALPLQAWALPLRSSWACIAKSDLLGADSSLA